MQIVINLDESLLDGIKSDDFDFARQVVKNFQGTIASAIANGTPIPDNATNGDVVKAMFPNLEIEYTDTDEYTNKPRYVKLIVGDTIITRMSADRWNAPYQKGGKE